MIEAFAEQVGPAGSGPVTCVGGRTQWTVGGPVCASAREVYAPAGVVAHEPGEMIVRVRAGTSLEELAAATAVGGQLVALEAQDPSAATVGGVLACGHSGLRRLGRGPVRDSVLEVTAVTADGRIARAGAPLVKNVTGFDLCRLLVGSVGTLALLAEVVLRCHPQPETEEWWVSVPSADVDPFELHARLYRPLALLWDGRRVWVGLVGHRADVVSQARAVLDPGGRFEPVDGPPAPPGPFRRSVPPGQLAGLAAALGGVGGGAAVGVAVGPAGSPAGSPAGRWLAEVGVGVVHCDEAAAGGWPVAPAPAGVVELHRRIKDRFDPTGRLNPGRSPLTCVPAEAL